MLTTPSLKLITIPHARQQQWVLAILVIGILFVAVRFNDIPVGAFFDDAHYLVLSESLGAGIGYRLINYPHAPVEDAFPPGWPLLLTPITALFPTNLFLPRLLSAAFWLGGLALAWRLFAPRLPASYRLFFLAAVALNPHLVGMAGTAMSESSFIFFSLLALLLAQRGNQAAQKRWVWWLLALATAVFAMLIRTIGLALLVALLVGALQQMKRRQLGTLALVGSVLALLLIPLAWFNARSGGSFVFSSLYSEHVSYVTANLGAFLRFWEHGSAVSVETLANAVVPAFELRQLTALFSAGVMQAAAGAVLLVVLIGWGLAAREKRPSEWFVLFYAGIFYLWVVYIGQVQPRIAIPLIPFLTFYMVWAVAWGTAKVGRRQGRTAVRLGGILLALLVFISIARNGYAWARPLGERIVDLRVGTGWLRENSPPNALVMTANAVPDYLYARRQTINYPRSGRDFDAVIMQHGVDYVLVRQALELSFTESRLDPLAAELITTLQSQPQRYELVYENNRQSVFVYQVKRS